LTHSRASIHFVAPAILPPGIGSGIYFGADAAMPHTFFPRSSNGAAAADTTLLTVFAAMNAIQIKRSAMISTIIVPNIPPPAPMILIVSFADLAYCASSEIFILHLNTKLTHQMDIIFSVINAVGSLPPFSK
jgi:hypothetical protein